MEPLWNSLQIASIATVMMAVAAILLARGRLSMPRGLGTAMDILFLLPLVLPPTVIGYSILKLLRIAGPTEQLQALARHQMVMDCCNMPFTEIAACIAAFPLLYLCTYLGFRRINCELIEATRLQGFGPFGVFLHVQLPLSWPWIAAGTLLGFVRALCEFGITFTLIRGSENIPNPFQTAPAAIFHSMQTVNSTAQPQLICLAYLAIGFASLALLLRLGHRYA